MYLSKLRAGAVCVVAIERCDSGCVTSSVWQQFLRCDSW